MADSVRNELSQKAKKNLPIALALCRPFGEQPASKYVKALREAVQLCVCEPPSASLPVGRVHPATELYSCDGRCGVCAGLRHAQHDVMHWWRNGAKRS